MSDQKASPTCNELGLCQAQFGRTPCDGCDMEPAQLALLQAQYVDGAGRKDVPRPCLELGVCQSRRPSCTGCESQPLQLVPGVIDGPYRREGRTSGAAARFYAWLGRKKA